MRAQEFFETDENYYIVCELMHGGELFDRLMEVGTFTEAKAACIIKQVLMGLNYLHQQLICHRDLKPENIMLEFSDKNKLDIKIVDFGFASVFDPKGFLDLSLGTLPYKAPELIQRKQYNEKVDIWAVGVITIMLLFGRFPFAGSSEHEIKEKIVRGKPYLRKSEV